MDIFRLIILSIITCLAAMLLKHTGGPWEKICIICGTAVILTVGVSALTPLLSFLSELQQKSRLSSGYANILFKTFGICVLCDFSVSVCNDQHYTSLAGAIEFACKGSVVILALPILKEIVMIFEELLL